MSDFTISQVARNLGITPQALYKRENFLKEKGFLYYKNQPNGKALKMITTEGFNYLVEERKENIEQSLVSSQPVYKGLDSQVDNPLQQEQSIDNKGINNKEDFIDYNNANQVMKLLLASKDNEIESLKEQIKNLNSIIDGLRETNKNLNNRVDAYINTHLLGGEVDKNYKKPSLFSRLFVNNKKVQSNQVENIQEANENSL